jgi:hypothetical protein
VANRERHRQGVVYGPVRPPGRRDRGAIVGSLLGIVVVVATVGLLGLGLMTVLQGRANAPLVTPTPLPMASPSTDPSALPSASLPPAATTPPATLGPTPATAVPATAEITLAPTPFTPAANVGPGYVTFGTDSNRQLQITDPKAVFNPDERMVWSAYLTERADSADLRVVVLKLDQSAPDGQRVLSESEVRPSANDVQRFLRRLRVSSIIDGPGLYTVRYVRGDVILSEGSFLVPEQG